MADVTYGGPYQDDHGHTFYTATDIHQVGTYHIWYAGAGVWWLEQRSGLKKGEVFFSAYLDDASLPIGDMRNVWVDTDMGIMQFRHLAKYGLYDAGKPMMWWYEQNGESPAPEQWREDLYYSNWADQMDEMTQLQMVASTLGLSFDGRNGGVSVDGWVDVKSPPPKEIGPLLARIW